MDRYVKNITASVRVCRRFTAGTENDPKDGELPGASSSLAGDGGSATAAAGAVSSPDARGAGRRREGAALFRSRKAATFGAARGDVGRDAGARAAPLAARRDERRTGVDAPTRADIVVGDARMSASTARHPSARKQRNQLF